MGASVPDAFRQRGLPLFRIENAAILFARNARRAYASRHHEPQQIQLERTLAATISHAARPLLPRNGETPPRLRQQEPHGAPRLHAALRAHSLAQTDGRRGDWRLPRDVLRIHPQGARRRASLHLETPQHRVDGRLPARLAHPGGIAQQLRPHAGKSGGLHRQRRAAQARGYVPPR